MSKKIPSPSSTYGPTPGQAPLPPSAASPALSTPLADPPAIRPVAKARRPREPVVWVQRLGRHHFAHLRAVAEGVDIGASAQRYLGIDHGHQAPTAHQQTLEAVRTLAKRQPFAATGPRDTALRRSAWRLIGLTIPVAQAAGAAEQPSLDAFIEDRGLDGFSEKEVLEFYQEAYAPSPKAQRRAQLRTTQLALLARLELEAAEKPTPTDSVEGWFDSQTAKRLIAAGFIQLGQLQAAIAAGGRWYRGLPTVGKGKAQRLAERLATLLPALPPPEARFTLEPTPGLFGEVSDWKMNNSAERPGFNRVDAERPTFTRPGFTRLDAQDESVANPGPDNADRSGEKIWETAAVATVVVSPSSALPSRSLDAPSWSGSPTPSALALRGAPPGSLIQARSDVEAVERWIEARAGSQATVRTYRKEMHRFLIWLRYERQGITLGQVQVETCRDYLAFLQHIPEAWRSRRRAAPGLPGWAPFRGALSPASIKQALTIVSGCFAWLVAARFIWADPWQLVNRDLGDDRTVKLMNTKSLDEAVMAEVCRLILAQPPSPARDRMLFIVQFLESVGLRSAELIGARFDDLVLQPEGWFLQVFGKGAKNRVVFLAPKAVQALEAYLVSRGVASLADADPQWPILGRLGASHEPIGYQALYENVRSWLRRCARQATLPSRELGHLRQATTHWLRHTFGTRAVARNVPLDVIQAQMGHASMETTAAVYGRAPIVRRATELARAFG